jgi:hypothetical protein
MTFCISKSSDFWLKRPDMHSILCFAVANRTPPPPLPPPPPPTLKHTLSNQGIQKKHQRAIKEITFNFSDQNKQGTNTLMPTKNGLWKVRPNALSWMTGEAVMSKTKFCSTWDTYCSCPVWGSCTWCGREGKKSHPVKMLPLILRKCCLEVDGENSTCLCVYPPGCVDFIFLGHYSHW